MEFPSPLSIKWLSDFINAKVVGETDIPITGINEIHNVHKGDIVFVDHPKYYNSSINSAATFIIINQSIQVPEGKVLFIVADPFESYLKIVNHFAAFKPAKQLISDSAVIGKRSIVFPNVFLGDNVEIGEDCIIHANVSIYAGCKIGNDVVIHSGTVIGSDAFYFNSKKSREIWFKKMNSCGRVIINDHVEIGANCTIDRGVSSDTIIGMGTKIDNLVHFGHEVVTGKNCLIAAQVGIAGCTILGDGVTLWGQVGVNKTLRIGDNAVVMAQSGVPGDLEAGKTYWGSPTIDAKEKMRELVWIKRIPQIWEKIKSLNQKDH